MILFYPYLKAALFTPVKQLLGRTMEFKTTLKGSAARAHSFKFIGPALLIVLLNLVTFIAGAVTFQASVNAAQGISLCWLVFNTVPHLTLLLNSAFGPGPFMVRWCHVGMLVTALTSALAIVLMWLLYPRELDYAVPFASSITFLQVRCATCARLSLETPLSSTPVLLHAACRACAEWLLHRPCAKALPVSHVTHDYCAAPCACARGRQTSPHCKRRHALSMPCGRDGSCVAAALTAPVVVADGQKHPQL